MKNCTKCGILKERSEFNKCSRRSDGLRSECKTCQSEYNQNRHPKYYAENRDKILEATAQWQRDNKDKVSLRNKKWRDGNKNKAKQINIAWRASNRSLVNASTRKYKATKKQQLGIMPRDHEQIMIDVYGDNRCMKCFSPDKIHIDHIIPASRGGLWCLSNFQFLCEHCNTSKNNRNEVDFRTMEQKLAMDIYLSWYLLELDI